MAYILTVLKNFQSNWEHYLNLYVRKISMFCTRERKIQRDARYTHLEMKDWQIDQRIRDFPKNEWEVCGELKKFDVEEKHFALCTRGVENAAARVRASHSRRSIYRRRVKQHMEMETAHSLARANVVIVAPGVRVTHLTTIESLRLRGRQQSCRKRRGAHFFCVGDALRIETDAFDSPRRIPPVAR